MSASVHVHRIHKATEITHLARETMPYAFSRTISDVLCTFKRFHNFIFHQSARWVYLGPGVKVGCLFWSARSVANYSSTPRKRLV